MNMPVINDRRQLRNDSLPDRLSLDVLKSQKFPAGKRDGNDQLMAMMIRDDMSGVASKGSNQVSELTHAKGLKKGLGIQKVHSSKHSARARKRAPIEGFLPSSTPNRYTKPSSKKIHSTSNMVSQDEDDLRSLEIVAKASNPASSTQNSEYAAMAAP